MSIYHLNMSNVSRAAGSSSCATLSYISGVAIHEERTNTTYSYGRAERVMCVGTLLPSSAPAAYQNPETLFNAIEDFETAENARTAKKIEIALPREFDLATQRAVVEDYIKRNLNERGYAATYAIHHDKDGNNPHAHILVANRQINQKGEWGGKRKMIYETDADGNRVPLLDKKTGQQKVDSHGRKQWKRINAEVNPLDEKKTLKDLRKAWADICNDRLEAADRIDHRSYADQGVDKIPTQHEGYAARAIAERGQVSEIIERNQQIREANRQLELIAAARQTCYANLVILKRGQQAEQKKEEERQQQEAADVLKRIEQIFITPEQRQTEAARAAARAAEEKRLQEQRRQAAAEAERRREDAAYEQYWHNQLDGMDWRQFEYFCKNEYHQRLEAAKLTAAEMWIAQNADQVMDYFRGRVAEEKTKLAPWLREHPEPPEPQPRAPLHKRLFGYTYTRSDGYTFKDKDYYIYKDSQESMRASWMCDYGHMAERLESAKKDLRDAEQAIQEKKYGGIYIHAEQDRYTSSPRHSTLFSMIEGGARKLIDTLKEFAPIRAMLAVVGTLAHTRGQERRQDLAREREEQRTRQQGRGGYYR